MRLLKRYSNRRLYDAAASRTITQWDLVELILAGEEVRIVESADGEDVTAEVLARTVAEQARAYKTRNPSELFRRMLLEGGEQTMSVLRNTILASIGALEVTRARAEKIIDDLIKKGELAKSDRKQAILELLDKAEVSTAKIREKVVKGAGTAQTEVKKAVQSLKLAKESEVRKLSVKVDELTRLVKALEKKLGSME